MAACRSAGSPPARPAARPATNVVSGAAGRTTARAAAPARSSTWSTSMSRSVMPSSAASLATQSSSATSVISSSFSLLPIVPRVDVQGSPGVDRDLQQVQRCEEVSDRQVDQGLLKGDGTPQRLGAYQAQQMLTAPARIDRDHAIDV